VTRSASKVSVRCDTQRSTGGRSNATPVSWQHPPVQHPAFGTLDENLRAQAGFIALDTILGEEEVERWIGSLSNEEALAGEFASRAFHAASLTQGDVRTAFVYIDGDTSTSRELETWADERGYETTFSLDPAWDAVRRFR
jgi:hypothetical protein